MFIKSEQTETSVQRKNNLNSEGLFVTKINIKSFKEYQHCKGINISYINQSTNKQTDTNFDCSHVNTINKSYNSVGLWCFQQKDKKEEEQKKV